MIQCHWELLIKAPSLNRLNHWSQAIRVTSASAVLSLGLDMMKRDISETTRCRHYYVVLCFMYGTLHPGVRAGMPAVLGHGRVCDDVIKLYTSTSAYSSYFNPECIDTKWLVLEWYVVIWQCVMEGFGIGNNSTEGIFLRLIEKGKKERNKPNGGEEQVKKKGIHKGEWTRGVRQMSVRVSEWWGVWWDLICCLLSTVHTLCSECEWDAGAAKLNSAPPSVSLAACIPRFPAVNHKHDNTVSIGGSCDITARLQKLWWWVFPPYYYYFLFYTWKVTY